MRTDPSHLLKSVFFALLLGISLFSVSAMVGKTAYASRKPSSTATTILPNHHMLTGNRVATPSRPEMVPEAVPLFCLEIIGGPSGVSRSAVALSYNLTIYVKNGCGLGLESGGGWTADFQVDCNGTLINENPELNGGLPAIANEGSRLVVDGHYASICGANFDVFAPDAVVVFVSANGFLTSNKLAQGGSEIEIE